MSKIIVLKMLLLNGKYVVFVVEEQLKMIIIPVIAMNHNLKKNIN